MMDLIRRTCFPFFLASMLVHVAMLAILYVTVDDDTVPTSDDDPPGEFSNPGPLKTQVSMGSLLAGDCAHSYLGIGVEYNPRDGTVFVVKPDGPAYVAGIHPGDVILSRRMTKGGIEHVLISRHDVMTQLRVPMSRICVSGSERD